jgi:hypothetical protein
MPAIHIHNLLESVPIDCLFALGKCVESSPQWHLVPFYVLEQRSENIVIAFRVNASQRCAQRAETCTGSIVPEVKATPVMALGD